MEFEVKYEDIAGSIEAENEVWKDFSPDKGGRGTR